MNDKPPKVQMRSVTVWLLPEEHEALTDASYLTHKTRTEFIRDAVLTEIGKVNPTRMPFLRKLRTEYQESRWVRARDARELAAVENSADHANVSL